MSNTSGLQLSQLNYCYGYSLRRLKPSRIIWRKATSELRILQLTRYKDYFFYGCRTLVPNSMQENRRDMVHCNSAFMTFAEVGHRAMPKGVSLCAFASYGWLMFLRSTREKLDVPFYQAACGGKKMATLTVA